MPAFHSVVENAIRDDNPPVEHLQGVLFHRSGCIFSREEGDRHLQRPGVESVVFHSHNQLRYVVGVYVA